MTVSDVILAAFFAGAGFAFVTQVIAYLGVRYRLRTVNRHNRAVEAVAEAAATRIVAERLTPKTPPSNQDAGYR